MYGIYDKGGVFLLIGHIGPSWTSNCFDLNYPENALCIYQKDSQSNRFDFSIQYKLKEVNRVPKITRDMEKTGPIAPNPKWNRTT